MSVRSEPRPEVRRHIGLTDIGPYITDKGDWYVPRNVSYIEARRVIKMHCDYPWKYVSAKTVPLCPTVDCDEAELVETEVWHFVELLVNR